MKSRTITISGSLVFILLFGACLQHAPETTGSADSSVVSVTAPDSSAKARSFIAARYEQAIGDFIGATFKRDRCKLDTLFVLDHTYGSPDDFPDIELPKAISGTIVCKLTDSATKESAKNAFKKQTPAVNIIGWVDRTNAEFVFVVFYPGYQHRFDYQSKFVYRPESKRFEKVSGIVTEAGEKRW